MRKIKLVIFATAMIIASIVASLTTTAFGANEMVKASCVNLINGSTSVFTDTAEYLTDGSIKISVKASVGYGTRALLSTLGEDQKLDVKSFSTVFSMETDIGVATVLSLQTDPRGTIGGGNGNGMHILLRKDTATTLTLALYNQNASKTFFAGENILTIAENKEVSVNVNYDEDYIEVVSGSTSKKITGVQAEIDSHYAEKDYKGYYTISSYYTVAVRSNDCVYVVKTINGITPKQNDLQIVDGKLTTLENTVNSLNDQSSFEDIENANKVNAFKDSIWQDVVDAVSDEEFNNRLNNVQQKLVVYNGKLEYGKICEALDNFKSNIENYPTNDETQKASAIRYYELINELPVTNMTEEQKNSVKDKVEEAREMEYYKEFVTDFAEKFVSDFESNIVNGKVSSLSAYYNISDIEIVWSEFKQENLLSKIDASRMSSFEERINSLKQSLSDSIYSNMWREGDTWEAKQTENGLYVTGKGCYGQTLGFNDKLTLGNDTEITFNIIYALRKLGANHLHIGFYPKTNTGTIGDSDGVRIDFWFSGTVIEVKPVNGRTEKAIYDAAYITVADTGFFDMENPDFEQGKYTVKLGKNDDNMFISVNGLETDITGIDPNIYNNGCYLTVSTMSTEGADYNELVITSIGNRNFLKAEESKKGCNGCNGSICETLAIIPTLIATAFIFRKKQK